jgi:hypothetical protein
MKIKQNEKIERTKRQFVTDGDYSSVSSCRTKSPATFRGIFGIFLGMSIFLFIFIISRETHNKVGKHWVTG